MAVCALIASLTVFVVTENSRRKLFSILKPDVSAVLLRADCRNRQGEGDY